jgi:hypothetical protein
MRLLDPCGLNAAQRARPQEVCDFSDGVRGLHRIRPLRW